MKIHEYVNELICIYGYLSNGQCLNFHLVPVLLRPKKITRVSTNMTRKIRVGRSENLFLFCLFFCLLEKDKNCLLGINIINST